MPLPYHWQMRFARWKQIFSGMFGGSGEKRPQLCPACGALVGIHANRCHECGTSLRFSLAAWSKGLSEFFGGHAPVTAVFLIVNVLMFGVSLIRSLHSGGSIGLFGGMSGVELFRSGENVPFQSGAWAWWRLILATFLHGGLLHIGFNMMVFMDIAPVVEELYGSARFLFLYVACGIGGSLCSTVLGKYPSVGASGAIMGIIGLLIAVTTRRGGSQHPGDALSVDFLGGYYFRVWFSFPGNRQLGPLRWPRHRVPFGPRLRRSPTRPRPRTHPRLPSRLASRWRCHCRLRFHVSPDKQHAPRISRSHLGVCGTVTTDSVLGLPKKGSSTARPLLGNTSSQATRIPLPPPMTVTAQFFAFHSLRHSHAHFHPLK